ncbi:MAG: N-acetyl-gamma-glutamyl-phosphate reductase, partial [Armatimonadetes bacterium]|nr:N-acetyl-gamma-glutamyl-phosphate reductase [Armatimonadota bacterium]
MINVSVIGASGYGGGEVVRLLLGHPEVCLTHLVADTRAGEPFAEVFPNVRGFLDARTETLDAARVAVDSDVVFLGLPNGMAMGLVPQLGERAKVIDLGADFRFRSPDVYEQWYTVPHTAEGLLEQAVYGLPELHRARLRRARIAGNPGCYPTAALLAVAPLLSSGLVRPEPIVVDAKSGVSGAGRGGGARTHFSEVNENVFAYGTPGHRHTAELEQELRAIAPDAAVTFVPHLIPMTRGLLATAYLQPARPVTRAEAETVLREAYAGEPFVRLLEGESLPQTKATLGSNFADVAVRVDPRSGMIVAFAALDNLMKGAAGQAVQNMNLMCGFPE